MLSNLRLLQIQTALAVCISSVSLLNASENVLTNTSLLPTSDFEVMLSKSFKYKKYVALKDINANEISLRAKINNFYGLYVNYESTNINFKGFNLHNQKIKLINKIGLLNRKNLRITTDLIYERNKANNVDITHNKTLNQILNKVAPDSNIKIVDNEIHYSSTTINIYDKNGNFIQPQVNISSLYSDSFGIKTYLGYELTKNSYFDFYLGYIKNYIYGKVSFQPNSDFINTDNMSDSISRDETNMLAGFTYFQRFGDFKLEFNYEYNKFSRDMKKEYNVNQLADTVFNYSFTKKLHGFFQIKYMTHQLMNYIPYSYNKLTSYSFSRHYGFFKTGLMYEF